MWKDTYWTSLKVGSIKTNQDIDMLVITLRSGKKVFLDTVQKSEREYTGTRVSKEGKVGVVTVPIEAIDVMEEWEVETNKRRSE